MKAERDKETGMGTSRRWCNFRIFLSTVFAASIAVAGLLGLHKPMLNGCTMTYMYPMYIPVPAPLNSTNNKYKLYLYHEGWKRIDYQLHLVKLSGVPVLFIPGNGGSYKQMRSVAAESDRAYTGGPPDGYFYQQSSFTPLEAGPEGLDIADLLAGAKVDGQYANHLDWFAVDLEGEHSAMDGWILEAHSEYVVQAVHRILDRYKDSLEMRSQHNEDKGEILPKSVILVGHSMGGFVARAAVVHPELRKGAVETVLTLSSPHRSPPLAMQPSFGRFFSRINDAWIRGYESVKGARGMEPPLSKVVVVSITGGARDYQVRSRMASLDGIVPATNGLTVASAGMVNVWLSVEHQSILWCNQMVVQVAHTLLQLIDKNTGQQFASPNTRLAVFVSNMRSALPQAFDLLPYSNKHSPLSLPYTSTSMDKNIRKAGVNSSDKDKESSGFEALENVKSATADADELEAVKMTQFACPQNIHWEGELLQDLHISLPIVNVLAMDGRRRWLDIEKLAHKGRDWFALVTNLSPCVGLRVHLWPEKGLLSEKASSDRVLEVTMKMVQLPSGPAPPQIEPGGQAEQVSPSGVLQLSPSELSGFRFLTISVAPRPSLDGSSPPSASMAVGQFYNPEHGKQFLSPSWLFSSLYQKQGVWLWEYHPMVWQLPIAVSLSTLPIVLDVKTASCGVNADGLAKEHPEFEDIIKLCKARCFPPVALVWDPPYGLEVFPNLTSQVIVVDSSPAIWGSSYGSEHTTILLLADPHCAYDVSFKVSMSSAASRFLLVHGLQIAGLSVAVVLFALLRQARAWEMDNPVPSILTCIEANLRLPLPFFALALGPLLVYFSITVFGTERRPSLSSFMGVSLACYLFANGAVSLVANVSYAVFYTAAFLQSCFRSRSWIAAILLCWFTCTLETLKIYVGPPREDQWHRRGLRWCGSACCSLQVVRKLRAWPILALVTTLLVFFVHPSFGLIGLLIINAWSCHCALTSHRQKKTSTWMSKKEDALILPVDKGSLSDDLGANTKFSSANFGEPQLEVFHHCHGILLLHIIMVVMLIPSLVAWIQRSGMDRTRPAFLDSFLSFGIILHGLCSTSADVNISLIRVPRLYGPPAADAGLSFIYLTAGLYCYWAGLAMAPYRAFYALAMIGMLTAGIRIKDNQARSKGDIGVRRRHFHKH